MQGNIVCPVGRIKRKSRPALPGGKMLGAILDSLSALPMIVRFQQHGGCFEARLRIPGFDRAFMGFGNTQNGALRELLIQIVHELDAAP